MLKIKPKNYTYKCQCCGVRFHIGTDSEIWDETDVFAVTVKHTVYPAHFCGKERIGLIKVVGVNV